MVNEWSAEDLYLMCERVRELAGCRPDCQLRVVSRESDACIYCEEHQVEVQIPQTPE